jgi:flagellar basal-body rod modification protein FlgD
MQMSFPQIASDTRANDAVLNSMPGGDVSDTFLTLLITQLKAQDPTSPMDPKDMVGQLVQFNTLGQIMKIRELMEQLPQAQPTGGK